LVSSIRTDYDIYSSKIKKENFIEYISKKFLSVVEVSMTSNYATRSVMDKKFSFESKLSILGM